MTSLTRRMNSKYSYAPLRGALVTRRVSENTTYVQMQVTTLRAHAKVSQRQMQHYGNFRRGRPVQLLLYPTCLRRKFLSKGICKVAKVSHA